MPVIREGYSDKIFEALTYSIVREVKAMLEDAGYNHVRLEPRGSAGYRTGAGPDLEVCDDAGELRLFDVAVASVQSVNAMKAGAASKPLAAAKLREREKQCKHGPSAEAVDRAFSGLVLEMDGGVGSKFMSLIREAAELYAERQLTDHTEPYTIGGSNTADAFRRHWLQRFSVVLWRGNTMALDARIRGTEHRLEDTDPRELLDDDILDEPRVEQDAAGAEVAPAASDNAPEDPIHAPSVEILLECYPSPAAANPSITATSSTACTDPTQTPSTESVHAPGTQATAHAGQSTPVSVVVGDDDDDDDDAAGTPRDRRDDGDETWTPRGAHAAPVGTNLPCRRSPRNQGIAMPSPYPFPSPSRRK